MMAMRATTARFFKSEFIESAVSTFAVLVCIGLIIHANPTTAVRMTEVALLGFVAGYKYRQILAEIRYYSEQRRRGAYE